MPYGNAFEQARIAAQQRVAIKRAARLRAATLEKLAEGISNADLERMLRAGVKMSDCRSRECQFSRGAERPRTWR